ncbi:hypothetical protein ACTXT7_013515 [Hymenolepis weldensis]
MATIQHPGFPNEDDRNKMRQAWPNFKPKNLELSPRPNGTHGVAERTGQGAVPDFTLDSRNVESHSSIYECLEKQVLPLTIGWLRQISGLKLQPRKLHKPNLNEARIWQQNEGIGFVRKHKCQCQEMLEKVNFECKDLENKDEINVVTKTADEVCKKQRWAVGKVQRSFLAKYYDELISYWPVQSDVTQRNTELPKDET